MAPKGASPRPDCLLERSFDHLIAAPGSLRRGHAHTHLKAAVNRTFPG